MKSQTTTGMASAAMLVAALLTGILQAPAEAQDVQGNTAQGMRNDGGDEILLQGFHWNASRSKPDSWYKVLNDKAAEIGRDGFTAVWMPVPWRDTSQWRDAASGNSGGGEGYFWQSFDKNTAYGSEAELKQAVTALHQAQVKVIYDVVPNHMDRAHMDPALAPVLGDRNSWRDGCAQCDDGEPFMGGDADLNTSRPEVADLFAQEFARLRDQYGADGLRFDFVKGYAAPTVDAWMKAFGNSHFCVGELWQAPNEYPANDWRHNASWQDALKAWSDKSHCTVFDFALKERLQNGRIADWRNGLNGNPDPAWRAIAVTFVDNHDTGYSPGAGNGQHHWALPEELRDKAYAYILTTPGTPTVYWPDMYDWPRGALIRQLIAIRKAADIRADSPVRFLDKYSGLVAETTGSVQTLMLALDSDLPNADVPSGFTSVLTAENGKIRIWRGTRDPNLVRVHLLCADGYTQMGQSVYAVGSGNELGNWNPASAVRLEDASQYPLWQGVVWLKKNSSYEWKCIVRDEKDPAQIRWQERANNVLVAQPELSSAGSF
ncbi:glucan 1,4-alpha-maltotetraohydrolase domain-containing protein [Pseudomonas sp. NPDC090202]|uniref:glucan 1,4-alpha-maltotetraohydrolase domain-containing protein n=1 Tax=unclassified Pseudomonas TaxID=196821 RepID=UPI0038065CE2